MRVMISAWSNVASVTSRPMFRRLEDARYSSSSLHTKSHRELLDRHPDEVTRFHQLLSTRYCAQFRPKALLGFHQHRRLKRPPGDRAC